MDSSDEAMSELPNRDNGDPDAGEDERGNELTMKVVAKEGGEEGEEVEMAEEEKEEGMEEAEEEDKEEEKESEVEREAELGKEIEEEKDTLKDGLKEEDEASKEDGVPEKIEGDVSTEDDKKMNADDDDVPTMNGKKKAADTRTSSTASNPETTVTDKFVAEPTKVLLPLTPSSSTDHSDSPFKGLRELKSLLPSLLEDDWSLHFQGKRKQVRDERLCVPMGGGRIRDDNQAPFRLIHCYKRMVANGPTDGRTYSFTEILTFLKT